VATDISDLGADKEAYRMNFVLRNNRRQDDFRRIVALGQAFSLSNDRLDQATSEVMDVDQWMRVMALHSLTGGADTYNMGLAHNLMLYVRPTDQKVLAMPWDVDHGFFYATNSPILGRGGSNLQKVITLPHNRRLFYKHLLDMVQSTYNVDKLSHWIEHYTQLTGFEDITRTLVNYVDRRSEFVLSELNRVAPRVDLAITTNGGEDLRTDSAHVDLEGSGWIDIDRMRLAGHDEDLAVRWTSENTWAISLPIVPGENQLQIEAFDLQGRLVGADAITVSSTRSETPLRKYLRISELMVNPASPTAAESTASGSLDNEDFEFIELVNTSTSETLDLTGVVLVNGPSQPLRLDAGGISHLAPGEQLVLVGNVKAFRARYGDDITVAGEYEGRLSNSGERLRLVDDQGVTIVDFDYAAEAPWPTAASGLGSSLEVIDVYSLSPSELGNPASWRASAAVGGSPGAAGGVFQPQAGDANRDREFDQRDIVLVLQGGKYLSGGAASWSEGDWNGDRLFDPRDIVAALQTGYYLQGPYAVAVDEALTAFDLA
jgi:hypothetical protein